MAALKLECAGDERAQWANFQQKNLFPFNVRLQLPGSDEKDEDADVLDPGQNTDHDIQEMVSQSIAGSQDGDDENKDVTGIAAAKKNISAQATAVSTDSKGKEKLLDKLKQELDKRLDSNSTSDDGSTAKPKSDKKKKEDPEIEYKLRTEGVQVASIVHNHLRSLRTWW